MAKINRENHKVKTSFSIFFVEKIFHGLCAYLPSRQVWNKINWIKYFSLQMQD